VSATHDEDLPTKHRKTKRNRQPRCTGRINWFDMKTSPCFHRVEKGHTLCIHHRRKTHRWYIS